MFEERAFCPDRRHEVTVAWREPLHEGHACLRDEPYFPLCLCFGAHCTGERCAAFGVPRVLMAAELARNGLAAGRLPSVQATCGACGAFTELAMLDWHRSLCPACGAVARPV